MALFDGQTQLWHSVLSHGSSLRDRPLNTLPRRSRDCERNRCNRDPGPSPDPRSTAPLRLAVVTELEERFRFSSASVNASNTDCQFAGCHCHTHYDLCATATALRGRVSSMTQSGLSLGQWPGFPLGMGRVRESVDQKRYSRLVRECKVHSEPVAWRVCGISEPVDAGRHGHAKPWPWHTKPCGMARGEILSGGISSL